MNGKGISPLLAGVILVAFTIGVAIIVTSVITSVTKSQTETAVKTQKCPTNALELVSYGCSNGVIVATISNIGSSELTSFSIFANINGQIYTNSTPENYNVVLKPGETTTLRASTTLSGEISHLRVMAGGDCPGVYIEVKNDTMKIGIC